MNRRNFISLTAGVATASLVGAEARAQAPAVESGPSAPSAPQSKLAQAISGNRMPLAFDGARFSGAGYDWLLKRGSDAQAFLLGEEHGIAENPKLAAQLFADLAPRGYRKLVVEISPPMAVALDRGLASRDESELRSLLTTPESRVAFFGLKEEAQWLQAARAALPGNAPFLWGVDYELAADRYLIRKLVQATKPATAVEALSKLSTASAESWAKYEQTHNPQFIFSFAGDPRLVAALRDAWPEADAEARSIMDTLEHTLAINAAWATGNGYESNLRRSRFMRANLLRHWQAKPREDRVFMKMGASHMVRGLGMSDVFDLGTLVPELVAEAGGHSFNVLVLPGIGSQTANLDPTKFTYVPGNREEYAGMEVFRQAVLPGQFTVFDTAALRPLASSNGGDTPLPLWRAIHGFDAVLVMTGSQPSSNL